MPIVLASASPRRRELLRLLGLAFDVSPTGVDETWRNGEAPAAHAERLAREKAGAVKRPDAAVVGADTIVVIDGAILGKPADAAEARGMLRRLAGREHEVFTAVAVAHGGRLASGVHRTTVRFRGLDDATIAEYVATGEPMDKAGAYGIQGFGAVLVEWIDGDYFTVMGLGLGLLVELLARVGLRYRFGAVTPAP
ncbi:MAG: septum formation protein Maf [Gemmatimonadetes bacterium 21-71-4]|nr:MAG: septum formation protein Maf [Gemmatimonadetes bacterium 21-71-4]